MKLFLCLIIMVLCTYIGRLFAKRTQQRLSYFQDYQSAVILLTDKITSMHLELTAALESSEDDEISLVFKECARQLTSSPQQSFAAIWRRVTSDQSKSYLSKEDVLIIMNGGAAIETLCKNPSEKQAKLYSNRLAAYLTEMEKDRRKKGKLFGTVGVLSGLFIALLII